MKLRSKGPYQVAGAVLSFRDALLPPFEMSWTFILGVGCDVFHALQFWRFAVSICCPGRFNGWILVNALV